MKKQHPRSDELEYQLAPAEALLAGTLALMTGYGQSAGGVQRLRLAEKIVRNFGEMTRQPGLSTEFRAAARNLQSHWQLLAQSEARGDDAGASARPSAASFLH